MSIRWTVVLELSLKIVEMMLVKVLSHIYKLNGVFSADSQSVCLPVYWFIIVMCTEIQDLTFVISRQIKPYIGHAKEKIIRIWCYNYSGSEAKRQ